MESETLGVGIRNSAQDPGIKYLESRLYRVKSLESSLQELPRLSWMISLHRAKCVLSPATSLDKIFLYLAFEGSLFDSTFHMILLFIFLVYYTAQGFFKLHWVCRQNPIGDVTIQMKVTGQCFYLKLFVFG